MNMDYGVLYKQNVYKTCSSYGCIFILKEEKNLVGSKTCGENLIFFQHNLSLGVGSWKLQVETELAREEKKMDSNQRNTVVTIESKNAFNFWA